MLLVERGLASSRTQAQRWISEGRVSVSEGGRQSLVSKPGQKLSDTVEFSVAADDSDRYVSRGGLKLAAALEAAALDVSGLTAIDVGASTGGFTDCLLQAGAAGVVCVDVGRDQLAEKLRGDARVINYEGINARELPRELLEHAPQGFDLAVMDVSFISQTKILPSLLPLLREGGHLLSLVKPQFEAGREYIGKGGIVRDESVYAEVEARVRQCCAELGMSVSHYIDSPIRGGDGNREFLLVAEKMVGSRTSDANS